MKAAVLHQPGATPVFEDFADPTPGEGEIVVHVKAVALENIDKKVAQGSHYSSQPFIASLPAIIGSDGIGTLDDGRLVGFGGMRPPYGAMAERAVIPGAYFVPIPEGISATTAAAVPSSTLSALFPLSYGARLQPGETVLVNGATGFAGKLALQVAKLMGAGRIVASGRSPEALSQLGDLGANAVIDLKQPDGEIAEAFKREAGESGYHVILDFLWGRPAELLLQALIPTELSFPGHRIRFVQIGDMAGPRLSLPADALRTSGLEIIGAGAGLTGEAAAEGSALAMDWIRSGKLRADIEEVPLKDIEAAWQRADLHGKRLVIVP